MQVRKYAFTIDGGTPFSVVDHSREHVERYHQGLTNKDVFNNEVLKRLPQNENDYRRAFVQAMKEEPEKYKRYENDPEREIHRGGTSYASQNKGIVNDSDETLLSRWRANGNTADWFEAGRRLVLVANELRRNDQSGKLSGLEAHQMAERAHPALAAIYNTTPS